MANPFQDLRVTEWVGEEDRKGKRKSTDMHHNPTLDLQASSVR
jgi:hypothetical protein